MSKFLRTLFLKWKNASDRKQVLIVVGLSAAILGVYFALSSLRLYAPPPLYSDLVEKGDYAFRGYRYAEALTWYERAEARLDAVIKFENESPSRNVSVLQGYDNSKVFIRARIQLALIADDVSPTERRVTR